MMSTARVLLLWGLVVPGCALADAADDAAPYAMLEQLACRNDPVALPTIAYLAKRKLIDLRKNVGGDSVSCYELKRTYDLDGLAVAGVCGSTEDALTRALWPDVFYRGPGTSPGIILSFSTRLPERAAKVWAMKNGIPPEAVGKSDWFEGMTQVECSSWMRQR